jgi:S1-C subfamily serine protease
MLTSWVVLSMFSALEPEAREALAARLAPSIVLLRAQTLSGEEGAHGTGFVVRADGLVITNHHVVSEVSNLTAVFSDGKTAKVLGLVADDPAHDLAIVQIDRRDLKALELATKDPAIGATVFMFGSPLDLTFSFTQGILSAIRPSLDKMEHPTEVDTHPHLQLQIATGPGASGSPILDDQGLVVGVNRAGIGTGIGSVAFAVPVADVRALLVLVVPGAALQPIHDFPWRNLAISGVFALACAGGVLFKGSRASSLQKRNTPRRRPSGYEE